MNYNGLKYLDRFFSSLADAIRDFSNVQVILVDNASTDTSVEFVKTNWEFVEVIEQGYNSGYAEGVNKGVEAALYNTLLICNNDIVFYGDVIDKLFEFKIDNPRAIVVQPKVIRSADNSKLDACGSFWSRTGFNYHYGLNQNQNNPKYQKPIKVYSIKGMCFITQKDVFNTVGGFDSDYWCYFEETDYCHKVLLAGYECWYIPDGLIVHDVGGTSCDFKTSIIQYHSFKNRLHSYCVNLELFTLIKVLPIYGLMNAIWIFAFICKRKYSIAYAPIRAFFWNVKNYKRIAEKRRFIKTIRKLSDIEFLGPLTYEPPVRYYMSILTNRFDYTDKEV